MTGTALSPGVSPEDIKRLSDAFPHVASRGGDEEDLARAAGVPVAVAQFAMTDPETLALLQDAQTAAEEGGRLLKPVAARLTLAMLQKLGSDLDAGTLDADDIGNLLPKVHKVVEHADRMEAARGDGNDGLATVYITIVNGATRLDVVPPAEVVDIEAREVLDE